MLHIKKKKSVDNCQIKANMTQLTKQTFKNFPSANLAEVRKVSFLKKADQKTKITLFKTHKEQDVLSSGKQ